MVLLYLISSQVDGGGLQIAHRYCFLSINPEERRYRDQNADVIASHFHPRPELLP